METGDITEGKAYGLLRVGKGLQEHPVLRTAAVEGRIPWTKARELFRLKESLTEEELLEKATSLSSRDLEDFVTDRNKFYRAKQKRLRAGVERAVSAAVSAGTIGDFLRLRQTWISLPEKFHSESTRLLSHCRRETYSVKSLRARVLPPGKKNTAIRALQANPGKPRNRALPFF